MKNGPPQELAGPWTDNKSIQSGYLLLLVNYTTLSLHHICGYMLDIVQFLISFSTPLCFFSPLVMSIWLYSDICACDIDYDVVKMIKDQLD